MLASAHAEPTGHGGRHRRAWLSSSGPSRHRAAPRLGRRADWIFSHVFTRSWVLRGFSILFRCSSACPHASTALYYPNFTVYDILSRPRQEYRCDFYKAPAGDVTEQRAEPQDLWGPNVQSAWSPGTSPTGSPAAPPALGGTPGRRGPVPLGRGSSCSPSQAAGKGAAPQGTGWGGGPGVAGRLRGCTESGAHQEGPCPAGLAVAAAFSVPVHLCVVLRGKPSRKRQRSCWEHLRASKRRPPGTLWSRSLCRLGVRAGGCTLPLGARARCQNEASPRSKMFTSRRVLGRSRTAFQGLRQPRGQSSVFPSASGCTGKGCRDQV